ncbi:hypothetical protein [Haladaptatus cibarius]|uniref:hypothetical protein n=1 Tax=Haladaptatus cibarius TaxID=453847 RepID=UPI000A9183B4|nr:hypothetical protein [Haladaptatus cibarius]
MSLVARLLDFVSSDDEAAYQCIRCGRTFERDHYECPDCGVPHVVVSVPDDEGSGRNT